MCKRTLNVAGQKLCQHARVLFNQRLVSCREVLRIAVTEDCTPQSWLGGGFWMTHISCSTTHLDS